MRRPEASQIGFRRSDFPRVRAAPSGRRKSPAGSRACIMLNPSVSASRGKLALRVPLHTFIANTLIAASAQARDKVR